MTEFNLSEKAIPTKVLKKKWFGCKNVYVDEYNHFKKDDVKEFIKILKEPAEIIDNSSSEEYKKGFIAGRNFQVAREKQLAGDKLK